MRGEVRRSHPLSVAASPPSLEGRPGGQSPQGGLGLGHGHGVAPRCGVALLAGDPSSGQTPPRQRPLPVGGPSPGGPPRPPRCSQVGGSSQMG